MATSTGAARTKPSPSAPPQPASSRVPLLLEPHVASGPLARDEGSLTVVTWVQGASANWLLLRYLHALLGDGRGGEQVAGVVLVSFLRDARFWVDGCTRLVRFFFFFPLFFVFIRPEHRVGGRPRKLSQFFAQKCCLREGFKGYIS